ncbi:MAG: hypothetical protein KBE23_08805 [Chloroflexi bacterium]|nr:hypothetical protein [Chloroflexota bacterium]MBP7042832.1 hypothetical protein [Chloroflexota bacterium]
MKSEVPPGKISQLLRVILLAFLAVVVSLLFWSVIRAPAILARDDNPRQVESELRIQRGLIFDRADVLLAENRLANGRSQRQYPLPAGSPVVGYYSLRHGTAGIEESYDAQLRGNIGNTWQSQMADLLHKPQVGRNVRLTLDAGLQAQADSLLDDQAGAVLLLRLDPSANGGEIGQILALASHPGYDPNQLDETFDDLSADELAPLLNRVTQGQYQPGLVLQPFVLAAALEQEVISLDDPVEHANRPVILHGVATYCATAPPVDATWQDVLAHRCPGPMQDLAGKLDLTQVFTDFGLTQPPQLPLNTETAVSPPSANPALATIGQDTLIVTPLQVGVAWAALAANGRLPELQLVNALQDDLGNWVSSALEMGTATAVSAVAAQSVRQALPATTDTQAFSTLVLSGPGGSTNAWYLGLAPANQPEYVVVVVVENSGDLAAVERIGSELLTAVTPR